MVVTINLRFGNFDRVIATLNNIEREVPLAVDKSMLQIANMLKKEMGGVIQREAKNRTGWLENSFHHKKIGKIGYTVYSMAPHARYVDEGTRPHFIPFGLGRLHGVEHPGAIAMNYRKKALVYTKLRLRNILINEHMDAIRRSLR